jgi:hypothetical protein
MASEIIRSLAASLSLRTMYLQLWSPACLTRDDDGLNPHPKKTHPMLTGSSAPSAITISTAFSFGPQKKTIPRLQHTRRCFFPFRNQNLNFGYRQTRPPSHHRQLQAHSLLVLPLSMQKKKKKKKVQCTLHPASFSVSRKAGYLARGLLLLIQAKECIINLLRLLPVLYTPFPDQLQLPKWPL